MPPTDSTLNDLIALAKRWVHEEKLLTALWFGYLGRPLPKFAPLTRWRNPEGKPAMRPDFVGTLEGVSGLMRELNEQAGYRQYWVWGSNAKELFTAPPSAYYCARHSLQQRYLEWFVSDSDRPGDCVGTAWLSVFGKEAG